MRYDIDLFSKLNEEYSNKPLVPAPPKYNEVALSERAKRRAIYINRQVPAGGKRVLEIGCGRGEVCRSLNSEYGIEVIGVDVVKYPQWDVQQKGVTLIKTDLTDENPVDLGSFDLIYSNSVWEHLWHPYKMLERAFAVLKPGGHLVLSANLYRGPKASHRYAMIFFPWPHLLFTDEVFDEYYQKHIKKSLSGETLNGEITNVDFKRQGKLWGPSWINQLSISDYLNYFNILKFEVLSVKYSITQLDEAFLKRFADKLERFPRYDLERDFIHVTLKKPEL